MLCEKSSSNVYIVLPYYAQFAVIQLVLVTISVTINIHIIVTSTVVSYLCCT